MVRTRRQASSTGEEEGNHQETPSTPESTPKRKRGRPKTSESDSSLASPTATTPDKAEPSPKKAKKGRKKRKSEIIEEEKAAEVDEHDVQSHIHAEDADKTDAEHIAGDDIHKDKIDPDSIPLKEPELEPTLKKPELEPTLRKPELEPTLRKPELEPTLRKLKQKPILKELDTSLQASEGTLKKPEPTSKEPEPTSKEPVPALKKPEPTLKEPAPALKKPEPKAVIKAEDVPNEPSPIVEPTESVKKEREMEKERAAREIDPSIFLDEDKPVMQLQRQKDVSSRSCPYLDTINRHVLDFDFEKLCSVSLSHVNVYACLVCGKYFQGRGQGTYAYTHSVDIGHRVFINLGTLKFYCLPDNYEIIDSSLEDIRFVLNPTFTKEHIRGLDKAYKLSRAVEGATYRPGLMGLNNIKANDYCNVVFHALANIPPIRDYFLREENYKAIKRPVGDILSLLPHRFGELVRKLWNPRAFKAHVSPHEMLQAVVLCSKKQFQFTKQSDAVDLLSWLLNTLHIALNGGKKNNSSIVYKTLRGRMRVYSRKVVPVELSESEQVQLLQNQEYKETEEEAPFLYLTLDLPPAPVHRDEMLQNVIPQVPLGQLLNKFNGTAEKEYKTYRDNIMKRFVLTKLPQYLIVCIKRFTKNNWFVEKNPTIVNFPIKNVDLFDCLAEDAQEQHEYTTYDLLANIVHDGRPKSGEGTYRCQVLHKATGKWFELEDLNVKEILPQMITLTESYIQVWELNTVSTREQRRDEIPESIDQVEWVMPISEFGKVRIPKGVEGKVNQGVSARVLYFTKQQAYKFKRVSGGTKLVLAICSLVGLASVFTVFYPIYNFENYKDIQTQNRRIMDAKREIKLKAREAEKNIH